MIQFSIRKKLYPRKQKTLVIGIMDKYTRSGADPLGASPAALGFRVAVYEFCDSQVILVQLGGMSCSQRQITIEFVGF